MNTRRRSLGPWLGFAIVAAAMIQTGGCSDDDSGPSGTGGSEAGADSGGKGGSSGKGGTLAEAGPDAKEAGAGGTEAGTGGSALPDATPGTGGSTGVGGSVNEAGPDVVQDARPDVIDSSVFDASPDTGAGGAGNTGGSNTGGSANVGGNHTGGSDAGNHTGGTTDAGPDGDAEAGGPLCATGCAVCTAPLTGNGQTDGGTAQTTNFVGALAQSVDLLGATITYTLCVSEGASSHAGIRTWVQTIPSYSQAGAAAVSVSTLGCESGMHTISFPIAANAGTGFNGIVTRWGFAIEPNGSGYTYDTVVVKVDSVVFSNVPAEAGTVASWNFAPDADAGDGGANLEGATALDLDAVYNNPAGSIGWTAAD